MKALHLLLGLGAALALAQPLGMKVQERITTSLDVAGLRVADIRRVERGSIRSQASQDNSRRDVRPTLAVDGQLAFARPQTL